MAQGITAAETAAALQDVKEIVQNSGIDITFEFKGATGAKDEFGKVITKETYTTKCYPWRNSPFDKRLRDSVAWSDEVEAIAFISKLEQDNQSKTLQFFKDAHRVSYRGRTYDIVELEEHMNVGSDFLYYRIGLRRKQR